MLGFLNINKPSGISSNAVLTKIKKKFNVDKIGHMGTLDPMASGVLPIGIGKATRMFDYFLDKTKKYYAEFEFGFETDTLDITGEVIKSNNIIPTFKDVQEACKKFIGSVSQIPPQYSAKKVGGANAYDLARKNIFVELKPCVVNIIEFKCVKEISSTKFAFEITCGSGTYIRALCRDLAQNMGCFATMTKLIRTQSGQAFPIENSINLDDFLKLDTIEKYIIPINRVFDFKVLNINIEQYTKIKNGINTCFVEPIIENTFLICQNKIIGVAEKNLSFLKIKTNLE